MDSKIEISKIVDTTDPITVWSGQSLSLKRRQNAALFQILSDNIDALGRRSQQAQGLNNVLTSTQKLFDFPDQRCYLFATDKQFIGILKVGPKKLFHRTRQGNLVELELLCVLDFYVHESYQRGGIGKALFDTMLEKEQRDPATFGYDRPSPKFIGFLRKHFNLAEYVPQTNNFVVFDRCFDMLSGSSGTRRGGGVLRPGMQQQQQQQTGSIPKSHLQQSQQQQQEHQQPRSYSSSTSVPLGSASISKAMETVVHRHNSGSRDRSESNNTNNNNRSRSTSTNNRNNNSTLMTTGNRSSDYERLRGGERNNQNQNQNQNDESPQGGQPPSPQKQIPQPISINNNNNSATNKRPFPTTSSSSYGLSQTTSSNLNRIGSLLNNTTSTTTTTTGVVGSNNNIGNNSSSYTQQQQQQQQQQLSSSLVRSTSNPSSIGLGTSATSVYQAAIRGAVSTGTGNFGGAGTRRTASSGRFF